MSRLTANGHIEYFIVFPSDRPRCLTATESLRGLHLILDGETRWSAGVLAPNRRPPFAWTLSRRLAYNPAPTRRRHTLSGDRCP